MKTIWKFPMGVADLVTIHMPPNTKVLCVQVQHGTPCLWGLVTDEGEPESSVKRHFVTNGTGHEVEHDGEYIGTFQLVGGNLVFHVFEVTP